jgi:transcriptional regulator with GAF, ATPase, and Fis domain
VEVAEGGTLFIDEMHADVRIIAATNRRLEEEIRGGRFREDLWNVSAPPVPDTRQFWMRAT